MTKEKTSKSVDDAEGDPSASGQGPSKALAVVPQSSAKPIPGPFIIVAADRNGAPLNGDDAYNPSAHEAVNFYFGVPSDAPVPTKDQLDLQDSITQVLNTAKALYLNENGEQKVPFRLLYTRLFRLAQLGLEGGNTMPDTAKVALDRAVDDLIRAEGPRVKNAHLRRLGKSAALLALPFIGLYVLFSYVGPGSLFDQVGISPPIARCFMILWVGTFVGVWLSYAIRKADFKLRDLTVAESDFVEPVMRLVFSGLLASIFALFLLLNIIEISVGALALDSFASQPSIALLLGLILGLNDLLLPSSISKRSKEVLEKLQ